MGHSCAEETLHPTLVLISYVMIPLYNLLVKTFVLFYAYSVTLFVQPVILFVKCLVNMVHT